MDSIFYVQYDPKTYNLTHLTSDDMSNQNNWYEVAISPSRQQLAKAQYTKLKYNPTTKALDFPSNFDNNTNVVNNNRDIINNLSNQANTATQVTNKLKYKVSWNHLMSVFTLPDDLAYLKTTYGIESNNLNINISDFTKTGVYVVLPWTNLKTHDAPAGTNFNGGYVFKIYVLTDQIAFVYFTDPRGVWVNKFAVRSKLNVNNWKQMVSFN